MRLILLSVILLFSPLSVSTAPAAEEKFYQVDVLVFARDDSAADNEQFPPPRELPFAETIEPGESPESRLAGAAAELSRSGRMRVLAQRSWIQGTEEKKTAKPARIRTDVLDGTVQFYVSRFLHVEVNMQLRDRALPDTAYRIEERRRIKSQEINYFDHPRFGVLLQVTPIKSQAEIRR